MLGYKRTITRTNINVLINIGPGAGGGRKSGGQKGNLPNTFDDDCNIPLPERLLVFPFQLKWHFVEFCNRRYYPLKKN